MILRCCVVDDEEHAIEVLKKYIEKTSALELIRSYTDPLQAADDIGNGLVKPNIVFADIDMAELSGIEMVELFPRQVHVVFTTAFSDYAVKAFQRNAIDYILKPISYISFFSQYRK